MHMFKQKNEASGGQRGCLPRFHNRAGPPQLSKACTNEQRRPSSCKTVAGEREKKKQLKKFHCRHRASTNKHTSQAQSQWINIACPRPRFLQNLVETRLWLPGKKKKKSLHASSKYTLAGDLQIIWVHLNNLGYNAVHPTDSCLLVYFCTIFVQETSIVHQQLRIIITTILPH